mgnify:CR=1 FL=1
MRTQKTVGSVMAAVYFALSVWLAYRAGNPLGATEPKVAILIPIYALSVAMLYVCFMRIRNITRSTENVVTPKVLLKTLQQSKATPVDSLLAQRVKHIVLVRLIIMACFCVLAVFAIFTTKRYASGSDFEWAYYAISLLGVVAVAQIVSSRFKDV